MNIKEIGIIGAGTMGTGIASVCALKGFKTTVYDINEQVLIKSHAVIFRGYDWFEEKKKVTRTEKSNAEKRLYFSSEINKISGSSLIIEAAVENFDLKKVIYSQLDEITSEDTIFATNTSSYSITALSSAIKNNRSRVIGMHFFNPANIMKLVEVIKGEFTSDDVVSKVIEFAGTLGKTPVVCKDTPAFIVNRVARSFYGEALKILGEENIEAETIDKIMKEEGGFKMGPFELMDLIGIDVNYSVTKSVYEAFFHDPNTNLIRFSKKWLKQGCWGRKQEEDFISIKFLHEKG